MEQQVARDRQWDFRFGQVALMSAASGDVKRQDKQPFTLGDLFPSLKNIRGRAPSKPATTSNIVEGLQNWVEMCWSAVRGRGS